MRLFVNSRIPFNSIRSGGFFNTNTRTRRRYPICSISNHNFLRISSMATTSKPNGEEGTAKRFWDKFSKESILTLYTPFVVSLASGNLEIGAFGRYVGQDVHFFKCFAQAYELAEDCADDDDAKVSILELRKRVLEELKQHASFVQEWGLDLSNETITTPNAATLKYTNFLLATASGKVEGVKGPGELATPFEKTKVAAYTLGAMAPCMRLYVFLGKELKSLADAEGDKHPYEKWIDKYSSEAYQAAMLQTEDLLDKLSVSLTGEELDTMQKLYHQALKLEMEFFLAQPVDQPTVLPLSKQHVPTQHRLMIFSDFDLTCTVVDSSAILAEIAIVTAPKSDQSQPESQGQITRIPSADLRNTWEVLSRQYSEEYEQCMENMLANEKVESFDYEGLKKTLEQLSGFERRANTRVIESEVLKGLNLEDIKRAGERLILHDGCMQFFQSVTKNENLNVNVHVLSYCWCGDLIRSAFSSGGIQAIHVHANELEYEGSLSTGEIVKEVECPIDKLQAFTDILGKSDETNVTIYIGDSVGDLLCLLEADIGIVIGSSSSLRRIGTHFGISFIPLFPGLVKKQKEHVDGNSFSWKGLSGVLYTVSSWAEVHSFIIGS